VGTIRKLMAAELASSRLKPVPLRHRMRHVGLILALTVGPASAGKLPKRF
jgi:hypothetical protein